MSEKIPNPNNPYGEVSPGSSERNPWAPVESYDSAADQGVNPFAPRKLGADLSKSAYEEHYNESAMPAPSGDSIDWNNLDEGRKTMKQMGEQYAWVDGMGISDVYNQAANALEGKPFTIPAETYAAQSFNLANQGSLEDNPLTRRTYVEQERNQEHKKPSFLRKIGNKVMGVVRNLQLSRLESDGPNSLENQAIRARYEAQGPGNPFYVPPVGPPTAVEMAAQIKNNDLRQKYLERSGFSSPEDQKDRIKDDYDLAA